MRPPEWVLLENLILFEILPHSPAFIISKSQPIFLEQSIDARNTTVPAILEVIQGQPVILSQGLFSLKCVLGPYSLRVDEFRFPALDIPVQVWNQLIFLMSHTGSEVADASVSLFRVSEVRLWDQDVTH